MASKGAAFDLAVGWWNLSTIYLFRSLLGWIALTCDDLFSLFSLLTSNGSSSKTQLSVSFCICWTDVVSSLTRISEGSKKYHFLPLMVKTHALTQMSNQYRYTSPYTPMHHHTPLYTTIHPYTALYTHIHHHTPLYITTQPHTSPHTPIHHHTSLYITIHPYTSPYIPIHSHTPLYITIYRYTSPYTPIQHHIPLYTTIHP